MGQEIECTMRYQRSKLTGKAYLETDFILFRGEERLKILFRDLKSVAAEDGLLMLKFEGGEASLELGKAAQKWAEKILHPPSRLDKLGVKSGISLRLIGDFNADFLDELRARNIAWSEGNSKAKSDLLLYSATAAADLNRLPKLLPAMQPDGALWVVYPKGVTAIREIEVLESGRAAGLKDTKVAAFSATHTALKFVIPIASRERPVKKHQTLAGKSAQKTRADSRTSA